MARLRSLGYLGGTSGKNPSMLSGPAPADRIAAWETYNRASALAASGKRVEAAPIMRELLTKLPDVPDIRLSLGLLYQQEKRHREAASEFRELLTREPANAIAHFNLGLSLQAAGEPDTATKEFEAALALEPNYTRAEEMLAGQLLERRRFDEARAHYEHILKIVPNNFRAHYTLGALAASRENGTKPRGTSRRPCARTRGRPTTMSSAASVYDKETLRPHTGISRKRSGYRQKCRWHITTLAWSSGKRATRRGLPGNSGRRWTLTPKTRLRVLRSTGRADGAGRMRTVAGNSQSLRQGARSVTWIWPAGEPAVPLPAIRRCCIPVGMSCSCEQTSNTSLWPDPSRRPPLCLPAFPPAYRFVLQLDSCQDDARKSQA